MFDRILNTNVIKNSQCEKPLGIKIDPKLNCSGHIDDNC